MTLAEKRIWNGLKAHRVNGRHIRRQAPIGPYIVDFVCHDARLVIEIDGATHSTDAELARDARRALWLVQAGYRVLRFTNDEVMHNREGVLETVRLALAGAPPSLPSPSRGEGARIAER